MGFINTPPGKQRISAAGRPQNVNTAPFNSNGFVLRQAIMGKQLSSSSSLVARNNVAQQSGSKTFHGTG
jgi:hypothetical protein